MIEDVFQPVKPDLIHDNLTRQVWRETQVSCPVKVKYTLKHLSVPVDKILVIPATGRFLVRSGSDHNDNSF